MKKRVAFGLIPILALVCVGVLALVTRNAQAMRVQMNLRDLDEAGIVFIGPGNSSFEGMIAKLKESRPEDEGLLNAIKPYCVFLKNSGKRHIITYKIIWEMMTHEGKIISRERTVTTNALMGEEIPEAPDLPEHLRGVIRRDSIWLLSPMTDPYELGPHFGGKSSTQELQVSFEGLVSRSSAPAFKAALDRGDKEAFGQIAVEELAPYNSITISLDGVFLDDGSFIGPDDTGFFAKMKAFSAAHQDLMTIISNGIREKRSCKTILDEATAEDAQKVQLTNTSQPADYYQFYKNYNLEEIRRMRTMVTDEQAVDLLSRKAFRHKLDLRKVSQPK